MARLVKSFTKSLRKVRQGEWGFSLVEELVSLSIVALGLVMLISMISTGAKGVTATVDRATGEALARSQIESIKSDSYAGSYAALTPPSGYAIAISIAYWDTGSGGFVAYDTGSGLQKITVSVTRQTTPILSLEDYKVDR
jgi:type II secretory pathway pseudopilin PulG